MKKSFWKKGNYMAGHSKWANIKHKKERTDQKKGKIFSRIAKEIISAVKQKGPDPKANNKLRLAIQKVSSQFYREFYYEKRRAWRMSPEKARPGLKQDRPPHVTQLCQRRTSIAAVHLVSSDRNLSENHELSA